MSSTSTWCTRHRSRTSCQTSSEPSKNSSPPARSAPTAPARPCRKALQLSRPESTVSPYNRSSTSLRPTQRHWPHATGSISGARAQPTCDGPVERQVLVAQRAGAERRATEHAVVDLFRRRPDGGVVEADRSGPRCPHQWGQVSRPWRPCLRMGSVGPSSRTAGRPNGAQAEEQAGALAHGPLTTVQVAEIDALLRPE